MASLLHQPTEIIDRIVYFVGSDPFLGPPASLLPLLLTSRGLHELISLRSNPQLYADIFCSKFDISAARTRFGNRLTSTKLADELKRRCVALKRLKSHCDLKAVVECDDESEMSLGQLLFTAYTLILEDDGKNIEQLERYGRIRDWVREFSLHPKGLSPACRTRAPTNCIESVIGMWLFWFFLDSGEAVPSFRTVEVVTNIALNVQTISLSTWAHFDTKPRLEPPARFIIYSEEVCVTPTPLVIPAILSYFNLIVPEICDRITLRGAKLSPPAWREWDTEWARCLSIPEGKVTDYFLPGSVQGTWEGAFVFVEFGAYNAIAEGAVPSAILGSGFGWQKHTWRLREYHLLTPREPDFDTGVNDGVRPLPVGDALKCFFPNETQLNETKEGDLLIQHPGSIHTLRYNSFDRLKGDRDIHVHDIIIVGDGHSAWGQFKLVGRVRPCDGFITMLKDYVASGRGQWLYRGYLVGNAHGSIVGRWRDTFTPVTDIGYEGGFVMRRRA